jgi:NAD dependent epimerase/dehydratase family enzyme
MMKLILTGSTGMIGKEVFSQCIHNQAITSIIVLTRRSFPSDYPSSPKVKVVLHDFTSYSPSLLEELSGAEACIWYRNIHASALDWPLTSK